MAPFYRDAERLLDADILPYDAEPLLAAFRRKAPPLAELPELRARFSKCAPFSRRNMGATVGKDLEQSDSATLYLHANLTKLLLAPTGDRIEAALACNYGRTKCRFEASHFVLCPGTIETSRLLLASRSVNPKGVGNTHDQVGRYFHDHISLPSAKLPGAARIMFLESFGPFLFRRTAHTVNFEVLPRLREHLNLLAVMAHIIIDEPEDPGVSVTRSLLRSVQRGNMKEAISRELPKVPRAAIDIGGLAYKATFEKRRHASPSATVMLCLDSEQLPLADTCIRLDDDFDPLGMPKAVVDFGLTVHGISNLSIASAAVYPAGGNSNPSFTIIALALRLGDRLAAQLRA